MRVERYEKQMPCRVLIPSVKGSLASAGSFLGILFMNGISPVSIRQEQYL